MTASDSRKSTTGFAFPWLMNLIFEDRWLLAEKNPAVALQNQLRRRMKVDIRDPDPDTANFPNGSLHASQRTGVYREFPSRLLRPQRRRAQPSTTGSICFAMA